MSPKNPSFQGACRAPLAVVPHSQQPIITMSAVAALSSRLAARVARPTRSTRSSVVVAAARPTWCVEGWGIVKLQILGASGCRGPSRGDGAGAEGRRHRRCRRRWPAAGALQPAAALQPADCQITRRGRPPRGQPRCASAGGYQRAANGSGLAHTRLPPPRPPLAHLPTRCHPLLLAVQVPGSDPPQAPGWHHAGR